MGAKGLVDGWKALSQHSDTICPSHSKFVRLGRVHIDVLQCFWKQMADLDKTLRIVLEEPVLSCC
jgi:hypothetical protein